MFVRHTLAVLGTVALSFTAVPALAQDDSYDTGYSNDDFGADGTEDDGYVGEPAYYEDDQAPPPPAAALPPPPALAPAGPRLGYSPEQRDAWLADCRDRLRSRDDGIGGAIAGGVIGGIAGNRIAGRGHRTVGTVFGAGVGAIAGAAIDRAEDGGDARAYCEDYLARYEASLSTGYAGGGYAYGGGMQGYGAQGGYISGGVMWVPVVISGGCRKRCGCGERVVEEWVDETAPPPARRVVPRRDKRVKIQRYVK